MSAWEQADIKAAVEELRRAFEADAELRGFKIKGFLIAVHVDIPDSDSAAVAEHFSGCPCRGCRGLIIPQVTAALVEADQIHAAEKPAAQLVS